LQNTEYAVQNSKNLYEKKYFKSKKSYQIAHKLSSRLFQQTIKRFELEYLFGIIVKSMNSIIFKIVQTFFVNHQSFDRFMLAHIQD
jgi:hypothetical protein